MSDSNSPQQSGFWESAVFLTGMAAVGSAWSFFSDKREQSEAQKLFEQAWEYYQKRMFSEAFSLVQKSIAKNPKNAASYNLAAMIRLAYNDFNQTLSYSNKALGLATNSSEQAISFYLTAEVYARLGQLEEAISQFRECLRLLSNDRIPPAPSACFRLAQCYQLKQDFANAFHFLQRVLQVAPQNPYIHMSMADICLLSERYWEAINHYQAALQTSKDNPIIPTEALMILRSRCLTGIGVSYYNLENPPNSWHYLKLAHEHCLFNPFPLVSLAALSARQKDKPGMHFYLEKCLPLMVDNSYFRGSDVINTLLVSPAFEEYRDEVLSLLYSQKKITFYYYKKLQETLNKRKKDENLSTQNITIMNSKMAGISFSGQAEASHFTQNS